MPRYLIAPLVPGLSLIGSVQILSVGLHGVLTVRGFQMLGTIVNFAYIRRFRLISVSLFTGQPKSAVTPPRCVAYAGDTWHSLDCLTPAGSVCEYQLDASRRTCLLERFSWNRSHKNNLFYYVVKCLFNWLLMRKKHEFTKMDCGDSNII